MEQDGEQPRDMDQVVLESEPGSRLSYTCHSYQPEMKEMFGWSDEQFAELVTEPRSTVTFDIEPAAMSTDSTRWASPALRCPTVSSS